MSKTPKKAPRAGKTAIKRRKAASPLQADFDEVLRLIDAAKARALAAVNTALIDLHWRSASTSADGSLTTAGGRQR